MKQKIKLNEAQLRKIVAESVKKVLKEYDDAGDEYWQNRPTIVDILQNLSVNSRKAIEASDDNRKTLDWWLKQTYINAKNYVEAFESMLPN